MKKGKSVHVFSLICFILISIPLLSKSQIDITSVSGIVRDKAANATLPYANVLVKAAKDSSFIAGKVTKDDGSFTIEQLKPGSYFLEISAVGYHPKVHPFYLGTLSKFLDLATIELEASSEELAEVMVMATQEGLSGRMDKKTYMVDKNLSQGGSSVLQTMQSLPGITIQDGKVQLRGSEKVAVLIDGRQTALTGFGSQASLDNIPASSIEKIEIINNPSSKFDANGNAGIINIVFKKNLQEGWNGKVGLSGGVGALWVRKDNLPDIRPQYTFTPKINPTLSLNYRKNKINAFVQADNLYTQTLNKNEFVNRVYDDGKIIRQQSKRNRNTNFLTSKAGIDWYMDQQNMLTLSGMFGSEKITDRGDQPFFNNDLSERIRLWQFLEDELKTTAMATASYEHKFKEPGHILNAGVNYTFHREDEKYFFDNILPDYTGKDAFKLISDEHVADLHLDYAQPLPYGKVEGGLKFRYREIPTDMLFIPGLHSPLDTNAGGWATYRELIPAIYGNYIFESSRFEAEVGIRLEYVDLQYDVNPGHNTYQSDGYHYTQPFPTVRLAYKINERNKFSIFYNRRVDRPNELDIRIFPKYDDAEIIKVGNPALQPQFTNSFELGYKTSWDAGDFYLAAYHRFADATISRISSTVAGSNLIYAIFQNVGRSYNSGLEAILSHRVSKTYAMNLNLNGYRNQINAFSVENLYPVPHIFSAEQQTMFSGNAKLTNSFQLAEDISAQLVGIYLAPDIIPQGTIDARFSLDLGVKKTVHGGNGELFLNATDLLNTMVIKRDIDGNGFSYTSDDYYETQVIRLGYSYKF